MAKRGGRKIVFLLVTLAVLIGLAAVVDRIAAGMAEEKIGDAVAAAAADHGVASEREPQVAVTGFPFLTQVAVGEYSRIDIELTDVEYGEMTLPSLLIEAESVTASLSDVLSGQPEARAATLTGNGEIAYSSLTGVLENASGAEVTSEGGGELSISMNAEVAGQQIPVTGKATVTMGEGVLQVAARDFVAEGADLPPGGEGVLTEMAASMSRNVELPPLPYDLEIEELAFESDAMVLRASAQDVPLT